MKILLSFFLLFLPLLTFALGDSTIQDTIVPDSGNSIVNVSGNGVGFSMLDAILLYIKDSIFGLLAIITIAMLLYVGGLLITARGNPEQFKKALNTFLYIVVGLVIVSLAWAAVRLVAGFTI